MSLGNRLTLDDHDVAGLDLSLLLLDRGGRGVALRRGRRLIVAVVGAQRFRDHVGHELLVARCQLQPRSSLLHRRAPVLQIVGVVADLLLHLLLGEVNGGGADSIEDARARGDQQLQRIVTERDLYP